MTVDLMKVLLLTTGDTVQAGRMASLLTATSGRTWQVTATHERFDGDSWAVVRGEENLPALINNGTYDEVWITDLFTIPFEQEVIYPPTYGSTRPWAALFVESATWTNATECLIHRIETQLGKAFGADSLPFSMEYRVYGLHGTVLTAPSPATTGTSLTMSTGGASSMPDVPFYLNIQTATNGQPANTAEIVLVTAKAGDVLTIVRAQLGTTARSIAVGDPVCRLSSVLTDWDRFSFGAVHFPDIGIVAGVGNAHAAANATRELNGWDYDWGDYAATHPTQPEPAVLSNWAGWPNYPRSAGCQTLTDRTTWGTGPVTGTYKEGGHRWLLNLLPKNPGAHQWHDPIGKVDRTAYHDWWLYIANTFQYRNQ